MTAHFDLHNSSTAAPTTAKPTGRRRWLPVAPIGLVAASAIAVGGFAALHDGTNVERVGSRPSTAEVVVVGASRPSIESSIVTAERRWAGDEFARAPMERSTARPSIESSIVTAERRWAGDEFDVTSAPGLCLTQTPC